MVENSAAGLSLFDLLARHWKVDGEAAEAVFNHDDTVVIFRTDAGQLALASLKDAESPKIRTRMDIETGRTTIRPRENPVTPVVMSQVTARADLPVARFGSQGFAIIGLDGVMKQVTAGGNVVDRLKPESIGVTSICSNTAGETLALARQNQITLYDTSDMRVVANLVLDHPVNCQAFSSDNRILAAWGGKKLSLIDIQDPSAGPRISECDGVITEISWQKSGRHLSCASADNSFYIVNCATGAAQRVEGFPTSVRNTSFSEPGKALVTSGAFRLVGWDCNDLPENDLPGTPLTTGKPGFVAINVVAAHPERPLVASGYANGLLTIASIGSEQEMMLHQENATEVSCLRWSKTGEHLAIGYASGKVAIVTFPAQMFK